MIIKNNIKLKEDDFINEKELQTFFENNLGEILGLEFVATEFTVGAFRIDTVAFDEESKSFRIIEYKNVKNRSLIDQGYTYIKLLLERKADFVLAYINKTGKHITVDEVDWSQSRIIFVSPIFTPYQLNATDFSNIPFDLYKVTKYKDEIVYIDLIKKTSNVKMEETSFKTDKVIQDEIKVYTEEDHIKRANPDLKIVYETLKNKVLELDDIDVDVKKTYISFKGSKNIIDVEFARTFLQISFNIKYGKINDPERILASYVLENGKTIGHHGQGDYYISIKHTDEIDKIIPFVKQSLEFNKK